MLGRQTCVGCGRVSPETNGDNTLTTSFGWRVRRTIEADGTSVVEWRCANCWQRFKAAQGTSSSETPSSSPTSAPAALTPSVAPVSGPVPSQAPTLVPASVPSRVPRGGNR